MRRIVPIAAVLALSGIVAHAPSAWACTCVVGATPQKQFANADVVFVGKVTALATPSPATPNTRDVVAQMTITGVYKGTVPSRAGVRTAHDVAACGVAFVAGTRYAVFAQIVDGDYRADLCDGTTSDVGVLARAGFHPGTPATDLAAPAATAMSSDSRTGALIGSALIIVLVAAGFFIVRRRREAAGG
jgi:hypothetical protein